MLESNAFEIDGATGGLMKTIPMPLPEVADRYTIAKLKRERLGADQADPAELERQVGYYAEGLDLSDDSLAALVEELYGINGRMWDAEYAIRNGQDEELGLEEIGRRALHIRDLNRERMAIKNRITELTGSGFREVKMNYAR